MGAPLKGGGNGKSDYEDDDEDDLFLRVEEPAKHAKLRERFTANGTLIGARKGGGGKTAEAVGAVRV